MIKTEIEFYKLKTATILDVPLILSFIKELAIFEELEKEVVATEELLERHLFGERRVAEVIIGYYKDEPISFALFFHNFSTFLGKPGLYLEDLFVKSKYRGQGFGKVLISYLAFLASERLCGRFEWWCLDWNKKALDFYASINAESMKGWTVQRVSKEDLTTLSNKFQKK